MVTQQRWLVQVNIKKHTMGLKPIYMYVNYSHVIVLNFGNVCLGVVEWFQSGEDEYLVTKA